MPAEPSKDEKALTVSWSEVVRFVRQLSHDLRNDLNAAELQAAFLGELADDNAELKEEVKRLREMISKLAVRLQTLSSAMGGIKPTIMTYRISEFCEDLEKKFLQEFPPESAAVKWNIKAGDETFEVDPQLLQQAFLELFTNAFLHARGKGPIVAQAGIDNGKFVFSLREPKSGFESSTENWGREPIGKVGQGHYGLGLNRVRVILEAHGGELGAHYDPSKAELVTTVTLPIFREAK
jgi:signal transduction histidine kinase